MYYCKKKKKVPKILVENEMLSPSNRNFGVEHGSGLATKPVGDNIMIKAWTTTHTSSNSGSVNSNPKVEV